MKRVPSMPNCVFFDSFFFEWLLKPRFNLNSAHKYNFEEAMRRTMSYSYVNIFIGVSKVFFPVNIDGNHWLLVVFEMDTKKVRIYDSLDSRGYIKFLSDISRRLLEDFSILWSFYEFNIDEWDIGAGECSGQKNATDCGVWVVIATIELLSAGLVPHDHLNTLCISCGFYVTRQKNSLGNCQLRRMCVFL